MKIGVLFDGTIKNPGGYNQSLLSSIYLSKLKFNKLDLKIITFEKKISSNLENEGLNTVLFRQNIISKIINFLFKVDIFFKIFTFLWIKHPFTNFLKRNKFDLIIFLSPHEYAYHCEDINFVTNIWDIDHKKNSPFSEHRKNYDFFNREKILNYLLFHSFKIIVPEVKTKDEIIKLYGCDKRKILVQPFVSYLNYLNLKKINLKKKIIIKKKLPTNKKIIFYPATFWSHKNHKYILDAISILKKKNINKFYFVFCGSNKGNFNYINKEIKKNKLTSHIKIFSYVDNDFLITLYLKSFAIIMPSFGGPSNLPLYEAFMFDKPIFYNQDLIFNDIIHKSVVPIDINNPEDFCKKLLYLGDMKIKRITSEGKKYFNKFCSEEKFLKTYTQILKEFDYIKQRWK